MADDGSGEWLVKVAPFGIDGRSFAKQFSHHFLIAVLQCQMQCRSAVFAASCIDFNAVVGEQGSSSLHILTFNCELQRSPFLLFGIYVDSFGKHSLYQGLVSIFDGHEKYIVVELCASIEQDFCGSSFASVSGAVYL